MVILVCKELYSFTSESPTAWRTPHPGANGQLPAPVLDPPGTGHCHVTTLNLSWILPTSHRPAEIDVHVLISYFIDGAEARMTEMALLKIQATV